MREKFLRWLIRKILPSHCLSRIGRKGKKDNDVVMRLRREVQANETVAEG